MMKVARKWNIFIESIRLIKAIVNLCLKFLVDRSQLPLHVLHVHGINKVYADVIRIKIGILGTRKGKEGTSKMTHNMRK